MNSFVDCSLSSIVAQTTQDSRLEVKCNPKYKALLPYAMQYGESKFEFLNRLSYTYGELFFYDGRTLFFGTPDNPRSEDLYVDQDLTSLRTYSSAVPRKYIGYGYLPMEDQFVRTPECFKPNDKHWLIDTITKRSDYLFPDKGVVEAGTPAYHDSHIYDMADNRRSDAAGRMMNIEGETRTCRIKLGGLVNVFFPLKMDVPWLGQYRIIQIIHRVDKNGNYSNHFVAIPSQYEYVLERFMHKLVAYPEVATVSDNNDPKGQGRVKVQFYWQRPLSLSTNWLRVQTPDAGSSDKVSSNRGWVTIPEVGDQVMVGFEHGDPHRPFVMGSLFHGKSGIGGGVDNKNKSFSTKQGNYFRLNGSNGSVVLSTPLGAVFQRFDKDGNATIKAIKNHFVRAKEKASIEIIPQLPKGKDTPNDNTPPPSPSATFSLNNEGVIELSGNKSVTIKVGNSKITLSDGKVTIEGAKIDVKGEIEMN